MKKKNREFGYLEQKIRKYSDTVFFTCLFIALIPLFLIEMEQDVQFDFGFKYLSIPIIIISFIFSFGFLPVWCEDTGIIKVIFFTLIASGLITLMSGCYVASYNAFIGNQTHLKIKGTIINKTILGGKHNAYNFTINDLNTGKDITFVTTQKNYEILKIGEPYSETWIIGSLGLKYRYK